MSESEIGAHQHWDSNPPPDRDWKKIFLMVGLGILSWAATYIGMLELIEANLGGLPFANKIVIAAAVAMLMTMIVWLLDQIFSPVPISTRFIYILGYVFLTVISVGFGFGFYWKVLESRSETTRSAASAVSQVQGALVAASARLDQLQVTLDNLTAVSRQKATLERDKGTSCPNSRPGDGPRRKLRDDDAAQFSFASQFVAGRASQIKSELKGLDTSFALITKRDAKTLNANTGTRNEFMRTLNGKLDATVTRYNAFRSDPQLRQIRANLSERSDKTLFPTSRGGTFSCPDPQLQMALRGVVRAIDQLPDVSKPNINAVEGSEATIEAFRRLGATFFGIMSLRMPPSADELRERQRKAVLTLQNGTSDHLARSAQIQSGLSKRDYIPLAIAIFVDLCLLLVAMGRPMNRLSGLVPTMQAAEQGPMYQILSKFSEIHKTPEIREKFEIFRHVVFDFNGDYYVAVPLDAPYQPGRHNAVGYSTERIEELRQEAHLLANFFASFEKKGIFSRVYSPFLTTSSIQKRLRRQGSKFASSQAFRVYRFRDGAWSEIILNTIMRAAREIELAKLRRAQVEGPELSPMPAHNNNHAKDSDSIATTSHIPDRSPLYRANHQRSGKTAIKLPGLGTSHDDSPPHKFHAPTAKVDVEPDADVEIHAARFGPYAHTASKELKSACLAGAKTEITDDPDKIATSINTHKPDSHDHNVVPFEPSKTSHHTRPEPAPTDSDPMPRIFSSPAATSIPIAFAADNHIVEQKRATDVVITERQVHFSVPTTEATLPAGIRQALNPSRGNNHETAPVIDAIAEAVRNDAGDDDKEEPTILLPPSPGDTV